MSNASKPKNVSQTAYKRNSEVSNVGQATPVEASNDPKDPVRNQIASFYIQSFVLIVVVTIIITTLMCYDVDSQKDLLLAISGILSGPLGFIIGYYFKTNN